ncbi:MAG TPA: GlsB/YeaQ/YmgE family stress response membrane protein [Myxococcales bacterium]|nr:GlsB/YeaQ/YmgE family stress response membrane protein [Myxococcales bacterium]
MTLESLLLWLVIGLIAGWLASVVVGGPGGLVADIVVGIVGAFIGGWLFSALDVRTPFGGLAGSIFVAFIGAVVLLALLRLIRGGGWHRWREV